MLKMERLKLNYSNNLLKILSIITILSITLNTLQLNFVYGDDNNNRQPTEAPIIEPPFPMLINIADLDSERIHIVSESVDDERGYQTTEEYTDLKKLKSTFIIKDKKGHSVTHINMVDDILYRYSPYKCEAIQITELNPYDSSLWLTEFAFKDKAGNFKYGTMFGIASIWINAGKKAKTYEESSVIYSASQELYKPAHKWSVVDNENKTRVNLYFIDTSQSDGSVMMTLEMIQVESLKTNKVIRTLNILSVDNIITEDIYESILQVPIGYGCHDAESSEKSRFQFPRLDKFFFGNLLFNGEPHKIQLEVTGTRYDLVTNQTNSMTTTKRSSDTISVELVRTNTVGEDNLQMIRQRDSNQDTKLVLDYFLNIQYRIDLRRGTCEMSNMGQVLDEGEKVSLKFSNNLELNMDLTMMRQIFVDNSDYFFIKLVESADIVTSYFEKTSKDLFPGKISRIIRVYSMIKQDGVSFSTSTKLDTVMIRVFDDKLERIVSSFHINVIDAIEISGSLTMAKLFDVSEECYLNDDLMKSGRDYAWFQVSYSVMNRLIDTMANNIDPIKDMIYNLLKYRDISIFNAPRMEVMLNDDSMTVRILLIDLPPLQLLYDYNPDTTFSIDKSQGDLDELTKDLQHCADLCRLNRCKVMSYSEATYMCLLGADYPTSDGKRKLIRSTSFKTYVMPKKEGRIFEDLFQLSLHKMLADLQHKEYDNLLIPKMPDEMTLPPSETGLDSEERVKIAMDYYTQLSKFIKDEGHKIPILTFITNFDSKSVIFVPNKFEVEDDPLSSFDLSDKNPTLSGNDDDYMNFNNDYDMTTANFHEGLPMHHYKIHTLQDDKVNKENKAKLFNGLTYDQCALACIDGRCSSFSYCTTRQECIITDIWDIGSKISSNSIEQDLDCLIAQRDFISKFNKFSGVTRPNVYKKTANAFNPSECAHSCVIETDFNCLAFDFCEQTSSTDNNQQQATCFYRDERFIFTGAEDTSAIVDKLKPTKNSNKGCDHYSRSYLADFNRIEYRRIKNDFMSKLGKNLIEGNSVDQCADKCVNDFNQCTAFQFCFDPKSKNALQSCIMIDGRPEGLSNNDTQVIIDETGGGDVVEAGKIFEPDENCHIFSLRKDSSEAHLRELALNPKSVEEVAQDKIGKKTTNPGLSLGGAFFLFITMTIVFAAIGCGLLIARDRNEFVRRNFERVQILLRLN